ncbi:N-acetylmuramoyl-L-alanine amidase [Aureimonas fodinaquatilis]|uniref:N-acetylmuramoyl-L-alanine amidase n=2 Tax=Aureimonas fodinaquatilis TaxID=2565783 RepID=A0A5B0E3K0_9HYPH|nr:N-acetylmuramoyl-L-alanine amidase [Aureimonas fodinaquatilis]
MLVLHYTGMKDCASALHRLTKEEGGVSSHYLIEEDGTVLQLVPEKSRAWHAGQSFWRGITDINSRSIGVEIVNGGHDYGLPPFPPAQIEATIRLCRDCVDRWAIAPENVVAHSDIAPSRKQDPGELFPWDQLSAAGVGLHVPAPKIASGRFLSAGDRGQPVEAFQSMLAAFGYDLECNGVFDETTRLATIAFQRHHRPAQVDGVADASTIRVLHTLLTMRPSLL